MVSVSSNPQLTAQGYTDVNRIVAKDDAQGGFAGEARRREARLQEGRRHRRRDRLRQGLADEFKKAFEAAGGDDRRQRERSRPRGRLLGARHQDQGVRRPRPSTTAARTPRARCITKQMKEMGLKVPLMGGDMLYTAEYIKIAGGDDAEGDIGTALGLPLEQQPKGKEFEAEYKAAYGEAPEAVRQLRVRRREGVHRGRRGERPGPRRRHDAVRGRSSTA